MKKFEKNLKTKNVKNTVKNGNFNFFSSSFLTKNKFILTNHSCPILFKKKNSTGSHSLHFGSGHGRQAGAGGHRHLRHRHGRGWRPPSPPARHASPLASRTSKNGGASRAAQVPPAAHGALLSTSAMTAACSQTQPPRALI